MKLDPIIAISTNNLINSGIGIIRISLGNKESICKKIIKKISNKKFLFPRLFTFCKFYINNKNIDNGLIVYFPSPNSFNGETILECHMHGNINILKKMLNFCIISFKNKGMRIAEKGEFTKRAYENKKINIFDLKKIYNILNYKKKINKNVGVIKKFEKLIKSTFKIILFLENSVNFSYLKKKVINKKILFFFDIIKSFKKKSFFFFCLNKKVIISIIGNSNAGKSSLFNLFIKKKRSIISGKKGTTRDYISQKINIRSIPVKIYDTPGFINTKEKIIKKCLLKTKKIIKKSDILIYIYTKKNKEISNLLKNKKVIKIINKIDKKKKKIYKLNAISCKKKIGIKNLKNKIYNLCKKIIHDKNHTIINLENLIKELKIIYKNIIKYFDQELLLDELIYKIKLFHKKICILLNKKNKSIINNIFKNFCVGK
ncbi:GTPase [Candidatus Vidania fulgoroideorum]